MVGREVGLPGYARCRISGTPVYGCQGNTGVHRIDKGILSRVSIREAWIHATPPRRRRVQPLNELKHLGNWIPGRRGNAGCRFAFAFSAARPKTSSFPSFFQYDEIN